MTPVAEERYISFGLDADGVRARVQAGHVNTIASRPSRSVGEILKSNVFTRFNAILGGLLVIIAFVGPPQDGLFGVVLVVNAAIGVDQEIRAKRALDRLAVLTAPVAHIRREGVVADHPLYEVVADDVLELRPGDQLVADAVLLQATGLQLDESLLTGEAPLVDKIVGDEVLSGSAVVSGSGVARVTHVGAEAYAQRLQLEAKQFEIAHSELQDGTNRILRVISWILVPIASLLLTSQLLRSHLSSAEALRGSVAGVGAMVPEGLVLLTTIAFALGALRLSRKRVLVQTLPAIEGLARVDVVCIDKTGTLTIPGMTLERIVALGADIDRDLATFAAADPAPNATMSAIASAFHEAHAWRVVATVPFSSDRKWSAAEFEGHGSFVLGAPDVLFPKGGHEHLDRVLRAEGVVPAKRILALARSMSALNGVDLPRGLQPTGLVVLSEQLRADAGATVRYLRDQGVTLKVISGDDPVSVAAIARRVGIDVVNGPFDARQLPDAFNELSRIVDDVSVFGRVRPDQKRAIVEALQRSGHVVAMTGDGVNDVPALKKADVGIAMGSGSQASRAVANIVLLDGDFSGIPPIIDEGRRVIANIERVANLFVTKTVYALLLAVVVGIIAVPYPFYPRQLTVVSSFTIGIPGFFLALAPGAPKAAAHFINRIMRFAIPAGVGVAVGTLTSYALARGPLHASTASAKMAAAAALFAIAFLVLAVLARPYKPWRVGLVMSMAGSGVLFTLMPLTRRVFALSIPSTSILLSTAATVVPIALILLLLLLWRQGRPQRSSG